MLTAAEQRAQNVKAEKKSNDETYSFLKDPKDVRFFPCDVMIISYFLSRKMAFVMEKKGMTLEHSIYPSQHGAPSPHSRNK